MNSSSAADYRLRPFEALAAARRLVDNPADTQQVFLVLRAMRGRSGLRMFQRFKASPTGSAILAERRSLLDRLQDRAALAQLPEGSLGRTYFNFTASEQISADGLADASQVPERNPISAEAIIFRDRMRDMHDLVHVLTGYGRDPFGELCLLAFNYAQTRHLGMAMIALMGMTRFGHGPGARAGRAALFQGWRNGRKAAWLPAQDWEALLPQSLDQLRLQLHVSDPSRYLQLMS